MSSGTQIDLDWAGVDSSAPDGGQASLSTSVAAGTKSGSGAYLTDEEILGIEPPSPQDGYGARGHATQPGPQVTQTGGNGTMPAWMQTLAGDPQHGAEAQQLWQEHQAFRAAFSSPEEARAIKEMFPGGAQEAVALRQAAQEIDSLRQAAQEIDSLRHTAQEVESLRQTAQEFESLKQASQSVERIDAAIFSGDARAQSEVVAELARANPAAFRSLFAEAARVLSGMGQAQPVVQGGPTLRENREGWGTQENPIQRSSTQQNHGTGHPPSSAAADFRGQGPATSHESRTTNHPSQPLGASQSTQFDPIAYSNFERGTNDAVGRDVRSTISDTLARVLPEGVAEGAARRIGDDIFNEVHRALAADRTLSEQVAGVLRVAGSPGQAHLPSGQAWRFGSAEQQRVASLLAGRAKRLVPSVARRVIGEWTSSVLGTARTKAARQAAAASRVDIAAPGGSLDSMPLRAMSAREVNYASMSDDEILGM